VLAWCRFAGRSAGRDTAQHTVQGGTQHSILQHK
jgi:hypothetical protein